MNSAILELEQAAGQYLVQREPYPVIAPDRVEVIPKVINVTAKTGQKLLVFGTGSSFGEEYSLLRDNVVAITMAGIAGVEQENEHSVRVLAGTPIKDVLRIDGIAYKGSVGGFLTRNINGPEREARRRLQYSVKSFNIADGTGQIYSLPGPASTSSAFCGAFEQILGSAGRLAILISIELSTQLPIELHLPEDASTQMSLASAGRPAFGREAASAELDSNEIFKW